MCECLEKQVWSSCEKSALYVREFGLDPKGLSKHMLKEDIALSDLKCCKNILVAISEMDCESRDDFL